MANQTIGAKRLHGAHLADVVLSKALYVLRPIRILAGARCRQTEGESIDGMATSKLAGEIALDEVDHEDRRARQAGDDWRH
jgi:hypothetical protein